MSDWTGVYGSAESIKAGLDLEMPGPPIWRGKQTISDLISHKLEMHQVDDRVRKVLELVNKAKESGIPFDGQEEALDSEYTRQLLTYTSDHASVLLKNDNNILPIKNAKKIAVIGPNAKAAMIGGGGSAAMNPTFVISPLEAITQLAKELDATVEYAIGTASFNYLPLADKLLSCSGSTEEKDVGLLEFWLENPSEDFASQKPGITIQTKPDHQMKSQQADMFMIDGLPPHVLKKRPYVRFTGIFTPDQSGDWTLGLTSIGEALMFIDGKHLVENAESYESGPMWYTLGSNERTIIIKNLEAGKEYSLEIRGWHRPRAGGSPVDATAGLRIGAFPVLDISKGIDEAVQVAKAADTVIVIVGLNSDLESEGFDRPDMECVYRLFVVHKFLFSTDACHCTASRERPTS